MVTLREYCNCTDGISTASHSLWLATDVETVDACVDFSAAEICRGVVGPADCCNRVPWSVNYKGGTGLVRIGNQLLGPETLEQIENQLTSHFWLRHFIKRLVLRISHFPCKYATWKKT